MGAACGTTTPTEWQALAEFGDALGLAFQVVDDILDVTQASETLGKTAGKDLDNNKPTYVTVLGWPQRGGMPPRCATRPRKRWPAAAWPMPPG
jgi:geranylgeranyl pyrophosphate synthase